MLNELRPFLEDLSRGQWRRALTDNRIFRAWFRAGYPSTPRQQALIMFNNVFLHLHPVRIRRESLRITYTFCLGGLSFFLFLLLTITGVLLMFYYRPATSVAYQDMKDLDTLVNFGMLLRNLHRYSAHGMVIIVFLHMLRVFYTGAYRPPREFNWAIGAVLLFCTFFLSFTGYLLPWDQLAMWAVTVGTNMAGATPFLGNEGPFSSLVGMRINNDVRFVLLGGTMVGENTLLRFYVMHCVAVPLVVGILLILHFWRIRKDSFSAAPYQASEEKLDVWPHLVKREYIGAVGTVLFILVWSILMNAPLEAIANPNVTTNPSKAPWYFVGLQELLVYFDPWIAGVLLPGLIIVGLIAVPYIDRNPRGNGYYTLKQRPLAISLYMFGFVIMWVVLIVVGTFLRGPNWNL